MDGISASNPWYYMCYPPGVEMAPPIPYRGVQFNEESDESSSCTQEQHPTTTTHKESTTNNETMNMQLEEHQLHNHHPSRRFVRSERDDKEWPIEVLQMKCKQLNRYIAAQGISPTDAARLKSAKRRYLNRASAKKNRMKKKMERAGGMSLKGSSIKKNRRRSPSTEQSSPNGFYDDEEGEWEEEEEEESFTPPGVKKGGNLRLTLPICGMEDHDDDLQVRSPRFFDTMVKAVIQPVY